MSAIFARRRFLSFAAGAAALSGLPRFARAQEWPSKNIKAIVPFSAGSATDIDSAHRVQSAFD